MKFRTLLSIIFAISYSSFAVADTYNVVMATGCVAKSKFVVMWTCDDDLSLAKAQEGMAKQCSEFGARASLFGNVTSIRLEDSSMVSSQICKIEE